MSGLIRLGKNLFFLNASSSKDNLWAKCSKAWLSPPIYFLLCSTSSSSLGHPHSSGVGMWSNSLVSLEASKRANDTWERSTSDKGRAGEPIDEMMKLNSEKVRGGLPPLHLMTSCGSHRVWPNFSTNSMSLAWQNPLTASSRFFQMGSGSCSKQSLAIGWLWLISVKTATGSPLKKSFNIMIEKDKQVHKWHDGLHT